MPSFGEKLKAAREHRKISLEEISASTKIGTRLLQALEEDKFNQLPGGIFNKGFVRAYSHCVGLDEDQTVAEYLLASGEALPPRTDIAAREDDARANEEHLRRLESLGDAPGRQLPWGLFAAILLVVALALSLWSRHQREQARQSQHPVPPISAATTPPAQLTDAASTRLASNPSSEGENSNTSKSATATASMPAAQTSDSPSKDSTNLAATTSFAVTVKAREDSWILVTADGKTSPSETMKAGSERTFRAEKDVTIKAGNSGVLDFQFNGKKLDTGGAIGEVKTITFGPGGMVAKPVAPPQTQ